MEKILITGSNGFLGKSIVSKLKDNFEIYTLSRSNADFCIDLCNVFDRKITVDTVIHAAGKAHTVPKTEKEIKSFFDVNYEGTKKLVKNLDKVKNFIFISTVAVYGKDIGENIDESYPLKGESPYAKSKILAENFLVNWSKRNKVNLLILRLPLLAGKNPPGNLGAMVKAIKTKKYFSINKGLAKRSVVLTDDIIEWLPKQFGKQGIYNLTDNDNPSFNDLENIISKQLNSKIPLSIPLYFARIIGYIGDAFSLSIVNSYKIDKMTSSLTFSCEKAIDEMDWSPKKVKENFVI